MLFSKTKSPPPKPKSEPVPIPADLPDLSAPGQARKAPAATASSAPTPAPKGVSVLSADLTFEGDISGSGELQVDGVVKGDVRVGRLLVGETGAVEGAVRGDDVEVRGRVVGSVSGKKVKLMSTAYVDGDITHEQLSIETGAYFQGRCQQAGAATGAASAPAAPASAAPSVGFATPTPGAAPDGAQLIALKSTAQG